MIQNPTHRNPSKCLLLLYQLAPLSLIEHCSNGGSKMTTPLQLNHCTDCRRADLPFAGIDLLPLRALLAFNIAAPTHLALAGPGHLPALGIMASPAADSVAVLVLVALAGGRARRVLAGSAEIWRVFDVEQVHSARDLIVQTGKGRKLLLLLVPACGDLSLPGGLVSGAAHLDGVLVALLQLLADLMEGQELPPAGLHSAGARDAVALTSVLHSSFDHLVERQ